MREQWSNRVGKQYMSSPPARLVRTMSACSLKTRRAPSRHCRDARVYGHTTTAMHDMRTPPPPVPPLGCFGCDQCARAGRWDRGAVLLEKMKANPATPPDARTYASLIDACAKDDNWEGGLFFLAEMQEMGIA